jgi:hypothetical protein
LRKLYTQELISSSKLMCLFENKRLQFVQNAIKIIDLLVNLNIEIIAFSDMFDRFVGEMSDCYLGFVDWIVDCSFLFGLLSHGGCLHHF